MSAQRSPRATDDAPLTLHDLLTQTHEGLSANDAVKQVEETVNADYLSALVFEDDDLEARLGLGSEITITQLLERLELVLRRGTPLPEAVKRGLGLNNVLFMAAELLLLQQGEDQMGTLLIEEPEAHLHPQLQARFMEMLEARLAAPGSPQVILTTHSPLLAAGVDLDAVVVCRAQQTFPLRRGQTMLAEDDYTFLRRFLDATKANLFFARGVLVVEGDAENLLLPAIAKALGKSLTARGVSIVNVGHVGLFRYSRVFQRADGAGIPIPVACIADLDVPPDLAGTFPERIRPTKTAKDFSEAALAKREESRRKPEGGPVKVFVSPQWTLEHDMAAAGMAEELHQAVKLAGARPGTDRAQMMIEATNEVEAWRAEGKSEAEIACLVYQPMCAGSVSKAVVAEQLGWILEVHGPRGEELAEKLPEYLVEAINYVTSPLASAVPVAAVN